MKVNCVYDCATCRVTLAELREIDATNAAEAIALCVKPTATPAAQYCPRCSRVMREDGTPYGAEWKLRQVQIDDGNWIRIP